MHLTLQRVEAQVKKADKLMRVLWRMYSPYRGHRKRIVKSSYLLMQVVEELEELLKEVKKDFNNEIKNPLEKKSIPPGYHEGDKND